MGMGITGFLYRAVERQGIAGVVFAPAMVGKGRRGDQHQCQTDATKNEVHGKVSFG
ncbi:hypothetical protein D3C80_1954870 [compost metagenome]